MKTKTKGVPQLKRGKVIGKSYLEFLNDSCNKGELTKKEKAEYKKDFENNVRYNTLKKGTLHRRY